MSRSIRLGAICLILSVVFWSFTGIFVKHFSEKIDGDVQNLFRYAAATIGVWGLVLFSFRREALAAWRKWYVFLLPTLFNCVFQVTMVSGLYKKSIYPGFMSLLQKSTLIFSLVLAYVLFRDERRTILSRRYIVGCAIAIAGVIGVVMFGQRARADFREGVLLVLASSFLWSCYTLAMKHVVKKTRPLISFAIVSTYTTIFFIVWTSLRSEPSRFLALPPLDMVLVIVSGLMCISAAHSLYFRAVQQLGVAISESALLVLPLLTGILEGFRFGLHLNGYQMLMGVVLLSGTYVVIAARRRGGMHNQRLAVTRR